jgi:hypothetical protein
MRRSRYQKGIGTLHFARVSQDCPWFVVIPSLRFRDLAVQMKNLRKRPDIDISLSSLYYLPLS